MIVRGKIYRINQLKWCAKVNEGLQVLAKQDRPIPGLYAIGHDAGGVIR